MKPIYTHKSFYRAALAAAAALLLSGCSTPGAPQEFSSTEFLMDTVCTIRAGGDQAEAAVHAAFDAAHEAAALTDYYSDDSAVAKINAAPADTPVPLDGETMYLLQTALEVCNRSGGALDVTIAPVSDLWDFKADAPALPAQDELEAALGRVGYSQLLLDAEAGTLTKTGENVKLDLGGAAKGYAADRAAEALRSYGVSFAVIDLGGNVYVLGTNPKNNSSTFRVGIQKPFAKSGTYAQVAAVSDAAVVTSGNYQRYFSLDGKLYHHILDPKTGYPAENGMSSVSVISPSALLADCLSTACFVLGEAEGDKLAGQYGASILWEK